MLSIECPLLFTMVKHGLRTEGPEDSEGLFTLRPNLEMNLSLINKLYLRNIKKTLLLHRSIQKKASTPKSKRH